jgi:hypothetical protein
VGLADDLARIAGLAAAHAAEGEAVVGVLASEPTPGVVVYLCALGSDDGVQGWIGLDEAGAPVTDRRLVRDAAAIAALCELAGEAAFPGDLDELRARLVQLRMTERPPGIEEAEEAAATLQRVVGAPPTMATPARLDALGEAARRLEAALSEASGASPFATAMHRSQGAVDGLLAEIEEGYRLPLH